MNAFSGSSLSVVIVGAGPRGTGVLERLLANVDELLPDQDLHIQLVDPFPPGAGRVWRSAQSPLMLMNVAARNVTMFPDDTVKCVGPPRPGPSLHEWAASEGEDPDVATGSAFADRATQGRYLAWVLDRIIEERPDRVTVTRHEAWAVRVERRRGRQRVWLSDRDLPLVTDIVVLAMGHLDVEPDKEEQLLTDFADRHDLRYLPPSYTADVDLSDLRAGEQVAVRGLGLAFIDLMVLLTEERGGRFAADRDGRLRYLPCGEEPTLYVGSRRGVPYRAKIEYGLAGPPAPLPRFFAAAEFADREELDFHADLWPSIAKELAWGYYHELFTGHPDRVTVAWPEFEGRFSELGWDDPRMQALVESAVPDVTDRLDLDEMEDPLADVRADSLDELHQRVHQHVRADTDRLADPRASAELGAYLAMLSVHAQLPHLVAMGRLAARSYVEDLCGWWLRFFEFASSGPPGVRLRQLLALSEAGIVRFLGPGMWVEKDESTGRFVTGGAAVDEAVEATALVDARLPGPTLSTTTSELLQGLVRDAGAREQVLTGVDGYEYRSGALQVSDVDFRVLDRDGTPQPDRFALGPYTSIRNFATFGRPGTDAIPFRQNDILARSLLNQLAVTLSPQSTATFRRPA